MAERPDNHTDCAQEAGLEAQRVALRALADRQCAYIHQKLDEGGHPDDVAMNAWWALEIWTGGL